MELSEAGLRANREYFENMKYEAFEVLERLAVQESSLERLSNLASSSNKAPAAGRLCKMCDSPMKPSKAIECKLTGIPDFPDDKHACTVSPDPKQPMLVHCMKCENCGWSVK